LRRAWAKAIPFRAGTVAWLGLEVAEGLGGAEGLGVGDGVGVSDEFGVGAGAEAVDVLESSGAVATAIPKTATVARVTRDFVKVDVPRLSQRATNPSGKHSTKAGSMTHHVCHQGRRFGLSVVDVADPGVRAEGAGWRGCE